MTRNIILPSLHNMKRIVIKVGSSLLVDPVSGILRERWLESICSDIAMLVQDGIEIVVVTSGAVSLARHRYENRRKEPTVSERQGLAMIGQADLMQAWSNALRTYGIVSAQLLIKREDTESYYRYKNTSDALDAVIMMGALPVVNENDAVTMNGWQFGNNDQLSARIAQMIHADCVVLLSDVCGLYSADPRSGESAKHIPYVLSLTDEIMALGGGAGSTYATGGMRTKLLAARSLFRRCIPLVIAGGESHNPLSDLLNGSLCTWFIPASPQVAPRYDDVGLDSLSKRKIIICDAAIALVRSGYSLYVDGVGGIEGEFHYGDRVVIVNGQGVTVGSGISCCDSRDINIYLSKFLRNTNGSREECRGYMIIFWNDLILI